MDPRHRRNIAGWLLVAILIGVATPAPTLRADKPQPMADLPDVGELLSELRVVVKRMRANLAAQDKAWPTRKRDQLEERHPPYAVQKLQDRFASLASHKRGIIILF